MMASGMNDLRDASDIARLVEAFYARVRPDPLIGHFFLDLDWERHLPRIRSFWEMVLLGDRAYTGDPMTVHRALHARIPMERQHFERWLALFEATVTNLFEGPKADEAVQRARSIAAVMAHKVMTAR